MNVRPDVRIREALVAVIIYLSILIYALTRIHFETTSEGMYQLGLV